MRTRLQIGEISQLLGITQKTIRHYHKVGLLQEPQRTEAGYRLYSAKDLLRLQHIRRLQGLGLSLKQIKAVLGDSLHEHTLREVLQSLDEEFTAQIRVLEQRCASIRQLLDENVLDALELPSTPSITLAYAQEHLGDYLEKLSPALREYETRTYTLLDGFNWPPEYRESVEQLTHYFAQHPELYQQLLVLGERIVALAALPENAPEVEQLVEDCITSSEVLRMLSSDLPQLFTRLYALSEGAMADTMSELLAWHIAPAQRRFAEMLMLRLPQPRQISTIACASERTRIRSANGG